MRRTLAFIAALLLTTVAVGSACVAMPTENIRFSLQPSSRAGGEVQLTLRSGNDRHNNNMSSSFPTSELAGLNSNWTSGGPVTFALVREAGRVDCSGDARGARAEGGCRFTENRGFSDLLVRAGMARPTLEEAYGLTMVKATSGLLEALRAARYPMPEVEDYIAMTAVGVTPRYIADLAAAGYRPDDTSRLIEFAALKVTPAYLGQLSRAGYANLPQDEVVQLAALKIDPEFIRGFERIGYHNLDVDTLVQLKALEVTPQFVEAVRRGGMANPTAEQLVQLKAIGFGEPARRR
ncbi:hypothetical protein G7077_07480 [Sphingomonas piscis]|uniref:Uncharacterized protein n=1 Tax=Sphingomonas piscis TaxID=2714943 RepID=A0A6G7YPU7_9SPHN|nr:hypothetical protein [Sphingomonas piscis]QIK78761.1 hypothetical protein G7077_07480 [Sphingomonas piscis]